MIISNLDDAENKYSIIYADPPWRYNDRRNTHTRFCGGAMRHYDVMKTQDICNMPIGKIAKDNSVLFIWATFPNIQEAFLVIQAWGFKYKTLGFSWIKTNKKSGTPFFGIGYYTKSNCEVCLIATKGKLKPINNSISSVVISPREEHSKKPDVIRDKIVSLYGNLPRIELFARTTNEGWDSFGNELTKEKS